MAELQASDSLLVSRYAFSYIEAKQGMRKGDKIWQVRSHTLLLCGPVRLVTLSATQLGSGVACV